MRLVHELLDLVVPASCLGCRTVGDVWCLRCRPSPSDQPVLVDAGFPIRAAGEYAGELRSALLCYKERRVRSLAPALADYLTWSTGCLDAGYGRPLLVPVPSRRSAIRQRGGDHLLRLARHVGRNRAVGVAQLLRLDAGVVDSAALTIEERAANVANRMSARRAPRAAAGSGGSGRPVVLLDDVVTTGATLAEAGRALTEAGWNVVGGAVIAATRRHSPASVDRPESCAFS